MKILIIQLTRPGDIFCTWPTLSAIRRSHPSAEIHFLVRKKFAQAARDFTVVDHLWTFDSEKWLSPLIYDPMDTGKSILELGKFVDSLKAENFDQIINLSFSPSSSFITHLVTSQNTVVRGYTRSEDFYLHIPDEASRYFRAQVGLSKFNRIHVVDLFAMVANVSLTPGDLTLYSRKTQGDNIVCHLSASTEKKSWPIAHWIKLIRKLLDGGHKVQIVGGSGDFKKARAIENELACENLQDLIGQTEFTELARIISKAKVFIGADSGPLHAAALAGTPCLNLSLGPVKFWETGPTVKGSQVLVCHNPENLKPEEVYLTLNNLLHGDHPSANVRLCDGKKLVRYDDQGLDENEGWCVIAWLYFGAEKPEVRISNTRFISQIAEVCQIAEVQIEIYKSDPSQASGLKLLEKIDEVLKVIANTDRTLNPIIEYFFCEKENILPGTQEEVIQETLKCYQWLKTTTSELTGAQTNDSQFLGDRGSAQKVP